jgi:hypothetical protein
VLQLLHVGIFCACFNWLKVNLSSSAQREKVDGITAQHHRRGITMYKGLLLMDELGTASIYIAEAFGYHIHGRRMLSLYISFARQQKSTHTSRMCKSSHANNTLEFV